MKTVLLFFACITIDHCISAQIPQLVKNINPQDQGTGISSDNAVMGNAFYFGSVKKLWKTDGTPAGTVMVKDFTAAGASSIARFVAAGNYVFFSVDVQGIFQVWRSDGTEAGTILLKEFGSNAAFFNRAAVGNTVFFNGSESAAGSELWKSNGTAAGTVLVKDINPGTASSSPVNMKNINGVLYFCAVTSTGTGLWKSDGTEVGTVLIKDLDPASNGFANNDLMTAVGSKAFFYFEGSATGRELWVSDGTEAGTFLVKDIYPGSTGSFPNNLTALGNKLCFVAQDALNRQVWITDGTETGTVPLFDVLPNSRNDSYNYFTNCNGTLYFSATAGIAFSSEPYVSDGTTSGTRLLKDIVPGSNGSDARGYKYFNGKTYFVARTAATGYELWSSDNTEAGTALFTEIYPGTENGVGGSYLIEAVLNNYFIFSGNHPVFREEPYASDGTLTGTRLLKNIQTTGLGSYPAYLTQVGNRIYFSATLGFSDTEPWYTDGTEAGTVLLKDLEPAAGFSKPFHFINTDNTNFYFRTFNSSNARDIYKSDGTSAGTVKIVSGIQSEPMVLVNDILYFVKNDAASGGIELWKYQTGVASRVKDIHPAGNSFPSTLTAFNNMLLFFANDGTNGDELWKSDGTEAGTQLVTDINPGAGGSVTYAKMKMLNNSMYLFANKSGLLTLLKTDGTSAGTSQVKAFTANDNADNLYLFNNALYFIKKNVVGSQVNEELWRTDGTEAGTVLIKELLPYTAVSADYLKNISFFTHNGRFYFYMDVENLFGETEQLYLCTSDGTTAGTNIIKSYSFPSDEEQEIPDDQSLIATYDNSQVLFVFADNATGLELWKTDGTAAGTALVSDLSPGSPGSSPKGLINFNNEVYFSANNGTDLNELWKINTGNTVPLKLVSFTAYKRNHEVQVLWRTENEINSSHFDIERSTDGRNFRTIATIPANGQSANDYSFVDSSPLSGVNYYRLRIMDKDATFTFSKTVRLNFSLFNSISVNPNPASNFIIVNNAEPYKALRLLDLTSKEIKRFEANTSNRYSIEGVAKGIYVLQLLFNDAIWATKIVIE